MKSSVPVDGNGTIVVRAVLQALVIIADPPGESGGNQVFLIHVTAEDVNHFTENKACFLVFVGAGQHLSVGKRVVITLVMLNVIRSYIVLRITAWAELPKSAPLLRMEILRFIWFPLL